MVDLRTHPSLYGCGAIWKWMLKDNLHEDYISISGDDVRAYTYLSEPKASLIKDTMMFRCALQNSYYLADDLKTPLFGWGNGIRSTNNLELFSFRGVLYAPIGIIPKHLGDIMYDERMVVGEDHDIALQCKYFKRFYIIDNRYHHRGVTWTNHGGCSTLRNHETYKRRNEVLLQKWGSKVISLNGKKVNQISVHTEF
jgi:hypothetical protein